MDRRRYRPELVVWSMRDDDVCVPQFRNLGIPLHSLPSRFSGVEKLWAFRKVVAFIKPEVIHSYTFHTNFAAWWAALGSDSIAVGSSRSDLIFDRKHSGPLLGRLSARWPRNHISNNFSAVKNARQKRDFFKPERFSVVRNAIDCQSFLMKPLPISEPIIFTGIGSLVPVKRWDRLLMAARELKRRDLNFRVQIAGDGPLRNSLEKLSADLGVSERVKFLGHTEDVPGILAMSTFLAHTSDLEGCPNAVMEAMACGRAVIATDAGDTPDLVENGKTGFIVGREDESTLVNRLSRLIMDHDLCRSMGEAGRIKAEMEFGLNRLVRQTLDAYQNAGWAPTI
jgi:glycosyltransferase involved in cell wall biosynthesis